jgi:hypothetical protein
LNFTFTVCALLKIFVRSRRDQEKKCRIGIRHFKDDITVVGDPDPKNLFVFGPSRCGSGLLVRGMVPDPYPSFFSRFEYGTTILTFF